jgi:predicted transposase YbfD/YdcC
MIALKGCIVTIDAMGCRYKIADQIVAAVFHHAELAEKEESI